MDKSVQVANGHTSKINEQDLLIIDLGRCRYRIISYAFKTKFDLILDKDWMRTALPVPDWQKET